MIDKAEVYAYFAEKYYWGPEIVMRMTPAQMAMYMEGAGTDKRTGKSTRKFATRAEAEAFMAAMRGAK